MERLTYVAENGEVLFHPADLPDDEGITITQLAKDGRYKALEEIAERLANREQAEEQGLLLRLPCKVGDTIYEVSYENRKYIICSLFVNLHQTVLPFIFNAAACPQHNFFHLQHFHPLGCFPDRACKSGSTVN